MAFAVAGGLFTIGEALVAIGVLTATAVVSVEAWQWPSVTYYPGVLTDDQKHGLALTGGVVYGPPTRPEVGHESEKGEVNPDHGGETEGPPAPITPSIFDKMTRMWQKEPNTSPDQEIHQLTDSFLKLAQTTHTPFGALTSPQHHQAIMKWFATLAPSQGSRHELAYLVSTLSVIAAIGGYVKPFIHRKYMQNQASRKELFSSRKLTESLFLGIGNTLEVAKKYASDLEPMTWLQENGNALYGKMNMVASLIQGQATWKSGQHFWKVFSEWNNHKAEFTQVHAAWANYRQNIFRARARARKTMPYGRTRRRFRRGRRSSFRPRYRAVRRRRYRRGRRRY